MKKHSKYLRNPAPFALSVINPPKKKHRNAAAKKKRNPAAVPLSARSAVVHRKAGEGGGKWHHKKGTFLYNPAKKRRKARRKNPLVCKHVIVEVPKKKNPPRKLSSSPTMKHRKRSRRKNPSPFMKRGRSSRSRRNPFRSSRKRSRRMRNPVEMLSAIGSPENLAVGVGALAGVVGTPWLINTLMSTDAAGNRSFNLPGITYPTASNGLSNPAAFAAANKVPLAFYSTLLPAVVGYLLRNQAPRFARGVMISAVVNLGMAALKGTSIGTKAGLNAYVRSNIPGIKTYIPGVPPMLSGPATAFINNGAPVPSRGMNAAVDRNWMNMTTNSQPNPMKATG